MEGATLPKANSKFGAENPCLEDDISFPFGAIAVSFREELFPVDLFGFLGDWGI